MSKLSATTRVTLLAVTIAAMSTGCGWFHRGNKLYAATGEARPLEVPPELDTSASTATTASAAGTATASGTQQAVSQASSLGFAAPGTRDDVFARVGEALAAQQGVTIASRAQLLGVYDVTYMGASFLVRVSPGQGGGMYVSAVDPRGLPATGDAPQRLIEALRAAVAR